VTICLQSRHLGNATYHPFLLSQDGYISRTAGCVTTDVLMTGWKLQDLRRTPFAISIVCSVLVYLCPLSASTVTVRYREGLVHGFLVLRSLDGKTLADGELIQLARGKRVTCRLVFRFRDGSLHDETAIYTQQSEFRLVSDHLIQKGPQL
jgi:hypothetical protein